MQAVIKIKTKKTVISLPGRDIILNVVDDVETLITDPGDEDKVPCWAAVWPAARGLALWIWHNLSLAGEDVLELGAGLGLPGTVCAVKGARVTFSDFNPQALQLAVENAKLNGAAQVEAFLGDWRCFQLNRKFRWIICSDVTYDPKLNPYLVDIITKNLKPGGNLLVAHPGRKTTFDFLRELEQMWPWSQRETKIPVTIDDPILPYHNIYIHHWQHNGR